MPTGRQPMSTFHVLESSPASLKIRLGTHGLDGEADDLFRFVKPAVQRRQHQEIVIDGEEAYVVSLEGVATLIRLLRSADEAGVRFVLTDPHPVLRRKLELTGVLDLLTDS